MRNIIFIIPFLFLACNPCKYVSKHPECFKVDSVKIDTVTWITESINYVIDTASLDLYLECDSNYNVLIQEWSAIDEPGDEIKIVYKYKSNHLQIKSFADSIEVLNKLVEKYKTTTTTILNPINTQLQKDTEKYKSRLKGRMWLWWYFGASIVVILVIGYFKLIK